MRVVPTVVVAAAVVLAAACGQDPATSRDPGSPEASPEVIKQLAREERSVEEFDVCEALRVARSDEELQDLLDAESVWFDGSFVDNEDATSRTCRVTPEENGDLGLSVYLMQGTEFVGADEDEPVVLPGCRAAPAESRDGTTGYRISCEPNLIVDAGITRLDSPAVEPDALEDLLHDVLVAVSQQG